MINWCCFVRFSLESYLLDFLHSGARGFAVEMRGLWLMLHLALRWCLIRDCSLFCFGSPDCRAGPIWVRTAVQVLWGKLNEEGRILPLNNRERYRTFVDDAIDRHGAIEIRSVFECICLLKRASIGYMALRTITSIYILIWRCCFLHSL